jgi:hypothetical protein
MGFADYRDQKKKPPAVRVTTSRHELMGLMDGREGGQGFWTKRKGWKSEVGRYVTFYEKERTN